MVFLLGFSSNTFISIWTLYVFGPLIVSINLSYLSFVIFPVLPKEIVSDVSVEQKALAGINFISGLNDTYKQKVMDFMDIEVDLGILKQPLTQEQIFWEGS